MKYIITGANGYVGNMVATSLLEEGYDVLGLIETGCKRKFPFKTKEIDLLIPETYQNVFSKDDVVIHIAAFISIINKDKDKLMKINFQGTKDLFNEVLRHNVAKFIYCSTTNILYQKKGKIDENLLKYETSHKMTPYEDSKYKATKFLLKYPGKKPIISIILPSGILGPNDPRMGKLSSLIKQIYDGKMKALVKGGYAFCDVRDVKDAIIYCSKDDKPHNFIVHGGYLSLKEISQTIYEFKNIEKKMYILPTILAYIGLPFIKLYSLHTHIEPLYSWSSLKTIRRNPNFDGSKLETALNRKNINPRTSILDQLKWMKENKYID